jgi:uncharacterized protein (TIGR02594 family)
MAQYTVQSGDTAYRIATQHGLSLAQLQKLNPSFVDGQTGQWKTLHPGQILTVSSQAKPALSVPPWMQIALREQGVAEQASGDNPRILNYLKSCNLPASLLRDETAWCAAFVNWCLKTAGHKPAGSARVSEWHSWGRSVTATYGCICILQPLTVDQASSGHIGFLHAIEGNNVWLLSGNSANQVRISPYPKAKLHPHSPFRWPG